MSEMPTPPKRFGFLGGLPPVAQQALVWFGIFVAGSLIGWLGRGILAGPDDVPYMSMYEDWRLTCPASKDKDAVCRLSQEIADPQSGQPIASVVYLKDTEKDKPNAGGMVMVVTVPLNVLLEPGIGLKLGADDIKIFQYKTCTQVGCLAVIPMDKDMQKSLLGAQVAEVVVAGRDGKPVPVSFSTKGFSDAYSAYRNGEARHSSWWWRLWS